MKKHRINLFVIFACMFTGVALMLSPVLNVYAADVDSEDHLSSIELTSSGQMTAAKSKTVRVGFFEFDGYHEEDKNGIRSGYGYELMQKLGTYNDWVYEYVGYDKSWSEMQDMLANGEIDILTSAQKTESRLERFDFSNNSVGTSATILTARSGDSRFTAGDYSSYDGMKVGMLQNSSRNDSFAEFAEENGFTYTPVYYTNTDDLATALQKGEEIDTIVTSNLRAITNEWILEQFDTSPFYAIVQKGNTELLSELNSAIDSLDNYSPDWRTELFNKYYKPDTGTEISFSSTEREYLKTVSDHDTVFTVIADPDRAPYSYFENGEARGVMVEIFDMIAQRAGIKYNIIETADRDTYTQAIVNGEADIVIDAFEDFYRAETSGYKLTDSYLTNSISRITKKGFIGSTRSVAVLSNADITREYYDRLTADQNVIYYDSVDDCINAVKNGMADCTYVYTYSAQLALHQDIRNQLAITVLPEYQIDFYLAVNNSVDHCMISILSKAAESIKAEDIETIVQQETAFNDNEFSIIGFIYDQPVVTAAIVFLLVGIIFLLLMQNMKSKNAKKIAAQARELERFVGYTCSAVDTVLEVNLATMQSVKYIYNAGRVEKKEEPYRLSDEDDNVTRDKVLKVIEDGGSNIYFEEKDPDQDGVLKWFSYAIRAIPKDKQHPNNYIIFRKNIDESKRKDEEQKLALQDALEQACSASMAKGQFLSRMSHEIRTPLNAVIGYMDIASNSQNNPEKMLHCIDNSSIAARHLLNIINDVLDMSSIEAGKMKIASEPFDLKKQITAVSTMFFSQAKTKSVRFEVVIKDVTEEWVVGDSLRVSQILMNLLSNAVKFTPAEGKITLTVTQMNLTEATVFDKFEVSDTGIGMSEEYQKHLFKPFEQESVNVK